MKLKRCPFCGGEADVETGVDFGFYVECQQCGCLLGKGSGCGYYDTIKESVIAWNRRAE